MSNVVNIGEFRVTMEPRERYGAKCQHLKLTMDPNGEIVKCDDCDERVSAWYALQALTEWWGRESGKLVARDERQREIERKTIHLKAAQRVEAAWRSRSMVPTCPHCNEAVFPEDGFGGAATNREFALRRRAVTIEARQAERTSGAAPLAGAGKSDVPKPSS